MKNKKTAQIVSDLIVTVTEGQERVASSTLDGLKHSLRGYEKALDATSSIMDGASENYWTADSLREKRLEKSIEKIMSKAYEELMALGGYEAIYNNC